MIDEEKKENLTETLKQEISVLKEEKAKLEAEIEKLCELNDGAEVELAENEEFLTKKKREIEKKREEYNSLDAEYRQKEKVLDGLLTEKKKLLNSTVDEREKIAKEISSLLEGLKANISKEGMAVTEVYKKTADAANEQLKAAIEAGEQILEKLREDTQKFVDEREKLAAETLEKRKKILAETDALREKKLDEINTELKNTLEGAYEKQKNAEKLRVNNEHLHTQLQIKEGAIEAAIDDGVERRVGEIQRENESLKKDSESYLERLKQALNELNKYKRVVKRTESEDKAQLLDENQKLKIQVKELQLKTNAEYLKDEILAKAKSYDDLKKANADNLAEITRLNAQVLRLQHAEGINTVLTEIAKESGEKIDELKKLLQKFKNDEYSQEYRKKPIVEPLWEPVGQDLDLYKSDKELDEIAWLDYISEGIKSENFVFSKRLLTAFHTCVKTALWSPVTVLAGPSGTGKSELPRLYAYYGGLYFTNVPVKPDWDSPSSMLGYYNALERRFEAKPIIRGMYQMQDKGSDFSERLAVFLLDEMNLSHVELYFSDMLSKLEENRNKKSSESVTLDIDLGAGVRALPIQLTHNMFWVGTMNEDETTKSLSDKVIDRSNVIVFPRPEQLVSRKIKYDKRAPMLLKMETWKAWCMQEDELIKSQEFDKMLEKYKTVIVDINKHLEKGGRALGHRVWQSIQHYMAAHPYVIKEFKPPEGKESTALTKAMDSAFAEAVAFKVMSKLRGLETEGNTKKFCLDPIGDIISNSITDLKEDYEQACESAYGVFMWKSGKFLEDKKEETKDKKESKEEKK